MHKLTSNFGSVGVCCKVIKFLNEKKVNAKGK